jgi:hypothetical protein
VRKRRIRLKERELSRLILKLKLGYELPAKALLIEVQAIVLPEKGKQEALLTSYHHHH